ncbi:pirin family protein [Oerskovia sp. M15]
MSNLETRPREEVCAAGSHARRRAARTRPPPAPTARTAPSRSSTTATSRSAGPAPWTCAAPCRSGPARSWARGASWTTTGPTTSRPPTACRSPHPHTGLQTVSWLFEGEILHRDSVGSVQTVRPGELNLMTAGQGISHSEESPAGARPPLLHGVQLWVALPGTGWGRAVLRASWRPAGLDWTGRGARPGARRGAACRGRRSGRTRPSSRPWSGRRSTCPWGRRSRSRWIRGSSTRCWSTRARPRSRVYPCRSRRSATSSRAARS